MRISKQTCIDFEKKYNIIMYPFKWENYYSVNEVVEKADRLVLHTWMYYGNTRKIYQNFVRKQ